MVRIDTYAAPSLGYPSRTQFILKTIRARFIELDKGR